jgi:hypothetical protein
MEFMDYFLPRMTRKAQTMFFLEISHVFIPFGDEMWVKRTSTLVTRRGGDDIRLLTLSERYRPYGTKFPLVGIFLPVFCAFWHNGFILKAT